MYVAKRLVSLQLKLHIIKVIKKDQTFIWCLASLAIKYKTRPIIVRTIYSAMILHLFTARRANFPCVCVAILKSFTHCLGISFTRSFEAIRASPHITKSRTCVQRPAGHREGELKRHRANDRSESSYHIISPKGSWNVVVREANSININKWGTPLWATGSRNQCWVIPSFNRKRRCGECQWLLTWCRSILFVIDIPMTIS